MSIINVKFTTLEEQKQLYDFLAKNGYHWLSGQVADDPPTLLINPFFGAENIRCFRSLDIKNKKIGYYPFEIFSREEQFYLEKDSVSVNSLIANWDVLNQEVNA